MKTVKSFLSLLLIMAVIIPGFAQAKDTQKVGKITAVSGSVEVKKSGGKKPIKAFRNMAIAQGDMIITGPKSKVNMELDSSKEVIIGPNTKLIISQLVQSARAMGGKTSMSLLGGSVMVKVKKKLTGDSRFEIKTPTAIMGVMGTEFVVKYEQNTSFVGVIEGTVAVRKPNGTPGPSVHANEQAHLTPSGGGVPEALNVDDLPLFALDEYAEEVEQMLKTNPTPVLQALKERIDKARKEKQQAQDNEQQNEERAESPTIIHEGTAPSRDQSGGGSDGGGGSPSPVVKPTIVSQGMYHPDPVEREDLNMEVALAGDSLTEVFYASGERVMQQGTDYRLESGSQSGQQTIVLHSDFLQGEVGVRDSFEVKLTFASGYTLLVTLKAREVKRPELARDEFMNNKHLYVVNNKTFILPFTTNIAQAMPDEPNEPPALQQGVEIRENMGPNTWSVDRLTIDNNKLKIELSEAIPIDSLIDISIFPGTLKNKDTGDVQEEEQTIMEFRVEPFATPDVIEVNPPVSQEVSVSITSFGLPLGHLELSNDNVSGETYRLTNGVDYEVRGSTADSIQIALKPGFFGNITEYSPYTLTISLGTPEQYQIRISLFRKPGN
ncbi:FecR family protein [Aneurinibacillus sp. REN35]|uniref:FecR family protein n=1 Tax=Aneurinibacillus sp. REN35 TaxID=3237286 RepID=UPI003526E2FE